MRNSQETAESLDHLAEKAHLGVAWVRLEHLKYKPPPGRPSIPLQSRKIDFLLDEFRDQGCFPNVRRNRIQAKISQSVLNQVLLFSRLTADDLQDTENLRQLEFPNGIVLTHAHGQHRLEAARLEAARRQVDPRTVRWAVDLLNEDDLNTQFDVEEQNRNIESTRHSDGTAFCFRDVDESWRKKGLGSKRVEVDLKAIEKRPALYAALTALRPFVGLWYSFKKGTLERINCLKCDDELIHYLDSIKNTWVFIIGNDLELAEKIDESTVKQIEARAPMVSLADKEDIVQGFRDGTIFGQVGEGATRMRLQRNVLAVNGMISSITTFFADTLYLEESHLAIKVLIDPTTYQTRKALRLMWRGSQSNHVVLEYVDGLKEAANASIEEEGQFQIAYIQLWMFAMRNYPRLTNLFPKTDSKHKVSSTGPDPEWLRKFAAFAKALGFISKAINRLLEEDPDFVNVRDMLSKARPPNKFVYDVQSQTRSHCELLRRIQGTQAELEWDTTPVWTTEASKIKKKRRYGRSFERALEECKPTFFLHNMFREPPPSSGRYFTDLFVKRSMLRSFFQVPVLPVALSLSRTIDLDIVLERDSLPRKRRRKDDVVKQHNAVAEQATTQRQLEEENNITKDRLSKSENVLAGHLAQIRDYEKRIGDLQELEIEKSQQYSDSDRQSKETIEGLKRTIEDYASASKTQERKLAAQSVLVTAFQSSIGKQGQEEIIATNLANKITDLELNIQTQNTELKRYEQGATALRMINIRIKKTRETVEKMSSAIRQLQLEPDSNGSACGLQPEELSAIGEQFNEVDDLEKSIWNFITLYSQNNLPHDENEWQKQVPEERLAFEDKIGTGVEIGTLDLERMIALVSRRANVVYDLRSELADARESQRLEAERVVCLEGELKTARDATQKNINQLDTVKAEKENLLLEGNRATSRLKEETERAYVLETTLRAALQAASNKQEELKIELEMKEQALEELRQVDTDTLLKEAERFDGMERELNNLRAALQATGSVQAELDMTKEILKELRKEAGSNWEDLKSNKKRLGASERQIIDLRQELEAARQLVERRDKELASLTSEINDEDERIRSLKEQLSETGRLIGLEKEKTKLETSQKKILAARGKAEALEIQDLLQQEADVDYNLSQVEEQMVDARLKILTYAKHKFRLENSQTARHTAVEYVDVKDLEERIKNLHGQMIYCHVNKTMVVVELGNYRNFLANPKSLADHGEFFYWDHSQP
ncbi:hypothetical protein ACLOAV_004546 [Pseudogymnoascus australis]